MTQPSRRHVLQIGTALPLAMHALNLRAAPKSNAEPPKRIIFICNSLGFYAPSFFPDNPGDLSSSKYLKDLAIREKLTVFQNLFHPGMETSNHDSEKSFLTGAAKPESANFVNTESVDQVLVRHMGGETRFPFLSFSLYDRGWGCSWNDRGVAIPPMHDATQIYNKLFGQEDLTEKRRQIENDQYVIDCLYRDMRNLDASGRASNETYRRVISELEKQLEHEKFWLDARKPDIPNSLVNDSKYAFSAKIQNLLELAKLAFQTDSTRIITLSLDWIYGAINVPGATGGWHTLSHHGGNPETLKKLSLVEVDIVKHLNEFLSSLQNTKEGKGTLLDYTTVVIGSNFGDSSNHTCNNLPTIVAGGCHRHEVHAVLEKPTPLCNLWLDLIRNHGIDVGRFGSSQGDRPLLPA